MSEFRATALRPSDELWPQCLTERLGKEAPSMLQVVGPSALLAVRRTALFCSVRTPGAAILRTYDIARRIRDDGITVISGFHSPIEKECLRILLRGKQPIIICPARAIEAMRIPTECRAAFDAGRMLFLSPFTKKPTRVTKESAFARNKLVAALADEAYIVQISPGGQSERIAQMFTQWRAPIISNKTNHNGK